MSSITDQHTKIWLLLQQWEKARAREYWARFYPRGHTNALKGRIEVLEQQVDRLKAHCGDP